MEIVGDDPVLWVDAKTTTDEGFYADEHMRLFNQALAKAHARHPTLEVFRWSEVARSSWFTPDGIHYTSTGYARRAALIAAACRGLPRRRSRTTAATDDAPTTTDRTVRCSRRRGWCRSSGGCRRR